MCENSCSIIFNDIHLIAISNLRFLSLVVCLLTFVVVIKYAIAHCLPFRF